MTLKQTIELLSPAKDIETAKQAILHGADAVYIGGPCFGARHNAGNSLEDIAKLVTFAHQYHAKVFVTCNTILKDSELEPAQQLINQLYQVGVDALIIQDMGIFELDIPPIELHASTQCDIRSVDKAKFLSDIGCSQIVLARELNLKQIKKIHDNIEARIEFFIHGALCVSYSGQCYISYAQTGRSANRGECSQACRLPYKLIDHQGQVISEDKHLLSLKDNYQAHNLIALLDAGVRSFKIEGRYKDVQYVKNITAHYRQKLDQILEQRTEFTASSSGRIQHSFIPDVNKTFHRGSTDYFVNERHDDIGAFDSPKFIGEAIGCVTKIAHPYIEIETTVTLHNGDGLNVMNQFDTIGFRANRVEPLTDQAYRIFPHQFTDDLKQIQVGQTIYRNMDYLWQQTLMKTSSERRIGVTLALQTTAQQLTLRLVSEEGIIVEHLLMGEFERAEQQEPTKQRQQEALNKLGQTIYYATQTTVTTPCYFVPSAQLNQLRREAIEQLTLARLAHYVRARRKQETVPVPVYPTTQLSYLANVYNHKAREFYNRHGVQSIDDAYEMNREKDNVPLMITKHCLRYSFHLCPKQTKIINGERNRAEPMQLIQARDTFELKFDCKSCEMQVWGKLSSY